VPETIALRHILISWQGQRLGSKEKRTKEQALALAEQLHKRALAGEDFSELAQEYSDDKGSAARRGWLGPGQKDTWVPAFSEAAFQLQVGEVSPPTESPFGYHLIQRVPMDEIHLKQILVQHAEVPKVWKTDKAQSKTPEQAKVQAQAALNALESGQAFEEVAKQYSDGPMAPRGGDLGLFMAGELGPAVDQVALNLELGAHSEIFETTAGFHILERAP
jgi:parvulin-like peptidyl-prolyl isomerase